MEGGTIDHFDGATAQLAVRADAALGSLGRGAQGFFQPLLGQTLAGLDIGRITLPDRMATVQAQEGLNLTDAEMYALEELCIKKDLNKTAVLRQALKLYQMVEMRLDRGDRLFFEDDKTKEKAEVMML